MIPVLLVEDNEDHALIFKLHMQALPVETEIFTVSDGEQALDFLLKKGEHKYKNGWKKPKVAVIDLKLPKVGGLEVLEVIKKSDMYRDLVTVVLTSSSLDTDQKKAQALGVDYYLRKPVSKSEFERVLAEA